MVLLLYIDNIWYIVRNDMIYLYMYETGRKASLWQALLSCFASSANEFYILRQCTYIVFILQCQKKPKETAKLSKKSRNTYHSHCFLWCPLWGLHLYCYHFLPLLNMNQEPEKLYLGQWPCITKNYPVNAIWLFK
jgi:hypothetical protein